MAAEPRVDYRSFRKAAPQAYAALLAIGEAVEASGLDKALLELLKLRASQINGCAFCLQHHLNEARKLGVPAAKLDLVAAWPDAGLFSEAECAALAFTEALTHLPNGVSDSLYTTMRTHFSQTEIIALTIAIGLINNWNRIGVALRFAPPITG
jgi:AhpD family alkylhydroperoxidase